MPITIKSAPAFVTSDGKTHPTLDDAQHAELVLLFGTNPDRDAIANAVFASRAAIVEILATEPKKARKAKVEKHVTPSAN